MKTLLSTSALALAICLSPATLAAPQSAAARYEADRKLCADEPSSSLRMQCLRDARAEYERAKATQAPEPRNARSSQQGREACPGCGRVVSVSVGEKKGEGSALGIIGGGVAGALIGNQIGRGTGKTLATVAGAAGGAYAGNKVEEHVRSSKYWSVHVRLDNGTERTVNFDHDPGLYEGELVTVSGNTINRR